MARSLFTTHTLLLAAAACVRAATEGFPYGGKVRGVNLGGWLVLEPWITPQLFDATGNDNIIDEYTFGQLQDKEKATAALKQHWDTFYTEDDFRQIAEAGLNHVRLPVGYWAYDVSAGEPYIQGQLPYVEKAIQWARNHNLKVILDLHGAPGSQNGFDNSGQKLPRPTWQANQTNIERTRAVIKRWAAEYKHQTGTASVIAPLNEPAGFYGADVLDAATQYWKDSYADVRSEKNTATVLIHDAFQPLDHWNDFMKPPQYINTMMDTHIYQMFDTTLVNFTNQQHIAAACAHGDELQKFSTTQMPVVVGEWTPAADDCAKYLNGRGTGNRYEGTLPGSTRVGSCQGRTGDPSTFSAEYKDFLNQYWEAQAQTYERGAGWIQWTWKTAAQEWSYQSGLKYGWIPKNPKHYKHPNICNQGQAPSLKGWLEGVAINVKHWINAGPGL